MIRGRYRGTEREDLGFGWGGVGGGGGRGGKKGGLGWRRKWRDVGGRDSGWVELEEMSWWGRK